MVEGKDLGVVGGGECVCDQVSILKNNKIIFVPFSLWGVCAGVC